MTHRSESSTDATPRGRSRLRGVCRWGARATSMASLVLLGSFMFGRAESAPVVSAMSARELLLFGCFPVAMAAGLVLGWFRPLAGGSLAVAGLLGFHGLEWAFSGDLDAGPWFTAFTSPAFFFVAEGLLARRR